MLKIKEGFKGERLISLPLFAIEKFKNDELGRELYLTNMGYFPNAEYHYCKKEQSNASNYVLVYCVKGEGWLEYNGKKSKVTEDQFFILPQGVPYTYGSSKGNPWSIYWIYFNGKKAEYFSKGFDSPQYMPYSSQSRLKNKIDLFEEIFDTLQKETGIEQMLYTTSVFFHFLGTIKSAKQDKNPSGNTKENSIIDTSLQFMQENLHKHLSLKNIAEHANLSVSYFSRIFIAKTGISPSKYLTQLRMKKACHYLEGTDMKVNQISPLVGFEDPLYFSRMFTNYLKLSPTQYRENKNKTIYFRTATPATLHMAAV